MACSPARPAPQSQAAGTSIEAPLPVRSAQLSGEGDPAAVPPERGFTAAAAAARELFGGTLGLTFSEANDSASWVPAGYVAELAQELDFNGDDRADRVVLLGRDAEATTGEGLDCVMLLILAIDDTTYQVAGVNGHRFGCALVNEEDPTMGPTTTLGVNDDGSALLVSVQGMGMNFSYGQSYVVRYDPSEGRFLLSEFTDQTYDRRAMQGESILYDLLEGQGSSELVPAQSEPFYFDFPARRIYFEDLSEAISDEVNRWRPTAP